VAAVSGKREAGLSHAYQHLNLWRGPRLEVDTPALLVYQLSPEVSAAAKEGADSAMMIQAGMAEVKVRRRNSLMIFLDFFS
jgi:hypothetical protein